MSSVETSGAGSVAAMPPGTGGRGGRAPCACAQPLTAEFSGQPCAYYNAEIEREEVYYERDSQGRDRAHARAPPPSIPT